VAAAAVWVAVTVAAGGVGHGSNVHNLHPSFLIIAHHHHHLYIPRAALASSSFVFVICGSYVIFGLAYSCISFAGFEVRFIISWLEGKGREGNVPLSLPQLLARSLRGNWGRPLGPSESKASDMI